MFKPFLVKEELDINSVFSFQVDKFSKTDHKHNIIYTCAESLHQKCLCYGGRDGISVQILLEYSRIFGRQKLIASHIEIKRRFCKHDLNFMNTGVNKLTIALLSNPCT